MRSRLSCSTTALHRWLFPWWQWGGSEIFSNFSLLRTTPRRDLARACRPGRMEEIRQREWHSWWICSARRGGGAGGQAAQRFPRRIVGHGGGGLGRSLRGLIYRWAFTPAQPDYPAASVRDFVSGAYTEVFTWRLRGSQGLPVTGAKVWAHAGAARSERQRSIGGTLLLYGR